MIANMFGRFRHQGTRMAPVDAMWFWLSRKLPSDQFQVYAFEGAADLDAATDQILKRAHGCADFQVRARETALRVGYPYWAHGKPDPDQVVVHGFPKPSWAECLAELGRLMSDHQLDVRRAPWRVHLFPDVLDVPGSPGPSTVAVLQISHILADGVRSSAMAGYLFGRDAAPPQPVPRKRVSILRAALTARRLRRELERDIAEGAVPEPRALVAPLSTNNQPSGPQHLRTLVRRRSELPANASVTVGLLAAMSEALSGYLTARGEDVSELAVALPVSKPGERYANNAFDYVAVGLYPEATLEERLSLIEAELTTRRGARLHPAHAATERLFDAVPAPLRRLGVAIFNIDKRPSSMMAHTILSSVNRGAADLSLAGRPVILTSGYPAQIPICGLTHGAHGIGDTVAISVYSAESAMADIDEYVDRLDAALGPAKRQPAEANAPRAPRARQG